MSTAEHEPFQVTARQLVERKMVHGASNRRAVARRSALGLRGSLIRSASLASMLGLALVLSSTAPATMPSVEMTEVRRLAREPVETILSGAPVGRISDQDYHKMVHGSPRPVVVIFYANQDEKSRNLAT